MLNLFDGLRADALLNGVLKAHCALKRGVPLSEVIGWYFQPKNGIISIAWESFNLILSFYQIIFFELITWEVYVIKSDNLTDWHLQGVPLIHFILFISITMDSNKMKQIKETFIDMLAEQY